MTETAERPLSAAPEQGQITDEAVDAAKKMIGLRLRPEGPYFQDVTVDTIRNFCNGIGDVNPLYRDLEYGRRSRFGSNLAHPMFPMAYGFLGRTRWGLPGVHGFYAGNDWELFRNLRPGDRVSCEERIVGVEEKESQFSGRLVIQYVDAHFVNQRDELVARVLGTCTRHERSASKSAGKYKDTPQTHQYSPEERERIDDIVLGEEAAIRGREVRYWEDVQIGEEITEIARGPLTMMDTMGFLAACGRSETHAHLLKTALRHPKHYFRNPSSGGGLEYTGIGHHRESIAKDVGVPGVYDYGPQRSSWLATLVSNWMGDAGVLKRVKTELRRFNTMGDTTFCRGKVVSKYVKDGYALVDLEIWAENQRGERTVTNSAASVILPSKDISTKTARDGSGVDLGFATFKAS